MIISVLSGGLGNQLFQYAFGLRLASQFQTDLLLERHMLESKTLAFIRQYTPRQYELNPFAIQPTEASVYDTLRVLSRTAFGSKKALLLRESSLTPDSIDRLSQEVNDAVCIGYWQSEAFFKPVAENLRKTLRFQKSPSGRSQSLADTIRTFPNATFVHVRRGDYVSNTHANQYHGLCDVDYYKRAFNYLRERVPDAQFFVFSDDPDWVRHTMSEWLQPAQFVTHNWGDDSWQDMYLMSLCRHAIVANSSFSWWGAWLHAATDRVVVAPGQWFSNQPLLNQQITPPNWHCL